MDTTTEQPLVGGHAGGPRNLVSLDPDHPGFRDPGYRDRRDRIARIALEYRTGDPVPDADYTDDEHAVWRHIVARLEPLHERFACREYREASEDVPLDRDRIPQLAAVNASIAPRTGFGMMPVAGLVSAGTFLGFLGRDVFLATQYIRHHSRPLYTPEPDVVHELVGHAATLGHPAFAEISRAFGAATIDAGPERLTELERLYWYTLEFGVVSEPTGLKVCGAGLLSSFGELEGLLAGPELRPFDPEEIVRTPYDPTDYQARLFVAPSFVGMRDALLAWLTAR